MGEAAQGTGTQAQLHGALIGVVQVFGGQPQQHGQHALHVLQLHMLGPGDAHGPLHPGRAQVQVAHPVMLGHAHRGQ